MKLLEVQKNVSDLCQRVSKEPDTILLFEKLSELANSSEDQQKKILLEATKLYKNLGAAIEKIDTEISVIGEKKKPLVQIQNFIKDWELQFMQDNDINEVKSLEATTKLCKSPISVVIEDESKVPECFTETIVKPVKKLIKTAIENGNTVPGCKLEKENFYVKIN